MKKLHKYEIYGFQNKTGYNIQTLKTFSVMWKQKPLINTNISKRNYTHDMKKRIAQDKLHYK